MPALYQGLKRGEKVPEKNDLFGVNATSQELLELFLGKVREKYSGVKAPKDGTKKASIIHGVNVSTRAALVNSEVRSGQRNPRDGIGIQHS